jgi:hypothetical protein
MMARMRKRLCLVLAALVATSTTAAAEVIVIHPARDNTLFLDAGGLISNGAGAGLFVGNNALSNTRRALVFFDVADSLDVAAVIDSVELRLNVDSAPNSTLQNVSIHRVLASWGEGTSVSTGGAGAASTDGDATWLHRFYSGTFWNAPGGDFDPASSASTNVGVSGWHVWTSAALAEDVALWLSTPAANSGWLIQGPEDAPSTVRRFDSRETANSPELVIYYRVTIEATQPTTWGRLKSLYR